MFVILVVVGFDIVFIDCFDVDLMVVVFVMWIWFLLFVGFDGIEDNFCFILNL